MQLTETQVKMYRANLYAVINEGVDGPDATSKNISGRTIKSRQAYEEMLTHSGLGLFAAKGEGENATFDKAKIRYNPTFAPLIYELGVEYTQQSKNKDINGFIRMHGSMLADAWVSTRNFLAADLIQEGFSGGGTVCPDGKTLFASDHPNADGSTQSNVYSLDLNGANLREVVQGLLAQKGDRNLPVSRMPNSWRLVHGPALWGQAEASVNSNQLPGSMDNDDFTYMKKMIGDIYCERFIGADDSALSDMWCLLPTDDSRNPIFRMAVQEMSTRVWQEGRSGNIGMVGSAEELWAVLGWRGTAGSNP